MNHVTNKMRCPEFPHFGARYPDAMCIDGFLWDLDSGDENGLTHGGDDPCPFCNMKAFIKYHFDSFVDWEKYLLCNGNKKLEKRMEAEARGQCREWILNLHKKYGYVADKKGDSHE